MKLPPSLPRRARPFTALGGTLLVLAVATAAAQSAVQSTGQSAGQEATAEKLSTAGLMAKRTREFLGELPGDSAASAKTKFSDPERVLWAFGPVQREGLALGTLRDQDLGRLNALLDTALSEKGMDMWRQVRHLETVLHERESKPGKPATHRDPDLYWLRVYGTPSEDTRWSWRFEGHHLALHVTCTPGKTPTVTPFFVGASPATGVKKDAASVDVFGVLQTAAADLLDELGELDVEPANVDRPGDIRMGPGKNALPPADGLDARSLSKEQVAAIGTLMETYLELLDPELRDFDLSDGLMTDGEVGVHFAHWGISSLTEERAWSLRAPTFSLELATTSGADHVHVLLRSERLDFGGTAAK